MDNSTIPLREETVSGSALLSFSTTVITVLSKSTPRDLGFLLFVIFVIQYVLRGKKRPPGPLQLPLLGNLLQLPKSHPWMWFKELGEKYGPLVRVSNGLGQELLILNRAKECQDLLEKRSAIYSSRQQSVVAVKYINDGRRLIMMPYGPKAKSIRTAFHGVLSPRMAMTYEPQQVLSATKFLVELLDAPEDFKNASARYAARLILTLTYGKRPPGSIQRDVNDLQYVLMNIAPELRPGKHAVDSFPILDKLPDFLSPWRKMARERHAHERGVFMRLAETVRPKPGDDDEPPSLGGKLWKQQAKLGLDDVDIAYACGQLVDGGIDTTTAAINSFILAMTAYPHVGKRIQQELDSVLGDETPPTFEHWNKLTFVRQCVKESFRWRPGAPQGFPHVLDADDEYEGYFIPKGTTIIFNTYGLHTDPDVFPNADEYIPERWEGKADDLLAGHAAFGFGRRVCPGLNIAPRSLFMAIARLMWLFDIGPATDPATGKPIPVDTGMGTGFTDSILTSPLPFQCSITPRSAKRADIIRQQDAEADAELS